MMEHITDSADKEPEDNRGEKNNNTSMQSTPVELTAGTKPTQVSTPQTPLKVGSLDNLASTPYLTPAVQTFPKGTKPDLKSREQDDDSQNTKSNQEEKEEMADITNKELREMFQSIMTKMDNIKEELSNRIDNLKWKKI